MTNRSERKPEVDAKLARLRQRMAEQGVDGVAIYLTANLAWITAGAATYIVESTDTSPVVALITQTHAYAITDTIEEPRLRQEMALADLGFEFVVEPWYDKGRAFGALTANLRIAHDGPSHGIDFGADLRALRCTLQPEEMARLREGGQLAAAAMDDAIRATRPGDTEYMLAARLAAATRVRGGTPLVNLIASDDRIFRFRHPLPTAKPVDKYAMLVLCFRHEGLVLALTRLIHFGPLPDEVRRKAEACARVDARLILGTQPGRTLGEMWALARDAYRDEGYPEAIEEHHQGGSTGYQPREVIARPDELTTVGLNQAFGWNPSIRGVKSEDAILLTPDGIEVVTAIPGWPTLNVTIDGQTIARPAILEV